MAKTHKDVPVVLSGDRARAGVTGHNVRYVLAFGLAGSIIAFIALGLYYYYTRLAETLAHASAGIDLAKLVSFAIPLALGSVAIVLVLGLGNMVVRPRPEISQKLMRWRVGLQFIALCIVMAAFYLSARS